MTASRLPSEMQFGVDMFQFRNVLGAEKAFVIIVEAQYGIPLYPNLGQLMFDCSPDKLIDIADAGLALLPDQANFEISDMQEGLTMFFPRTHRARKTGDDR